MKSQIDHKWISNWNWTVAELQFSFSSVSLIWCHRSLNKCITMCDMYGGHWYAIVDMFYDTTHIWNICLSRKEGMLWWVRINIYIWKVCLPRKEGMLWWVRTNVYIWKVCSPRKEGMLWWVRINVYIWKMCLPKKEGMLWWVRKIQEIDNDSNTLHWCYIHWGHTV